MKRHKNNSNLRLTHGAIYNGYAVQDGHGPLASDYLDRLIDTTEAALAQYAKVFAFRLDLHIPSQLQQRDEFGNHHLVTFLDKFNAVVQDNLKEKRHSSKVRYIWVREFGKQQHVHYHLAILLNGNAYSTLGNLDIGNDNLFNRIVTAWARALHLPIADVQGCVHIPRQACYRLSRSTANSVDAFIHRVSYLCKTKTKLYGTQGHNFGSSRG